MHTFEAAYARIEELSKQVEALTNEKYQLMVERDDARSALVEIRNICIGMMDGWGQTVTVLAGIRVEHKDEIDAALSTDQASVQREIIERIWPKGEQA